MPSIPWKKARISYLDEGRGTAVVLLHGFCESSAVWDDWREDLLEEGLRIIRIDLPGFGETSVDAETIDEMAATVAEVTRQLKIKRGICIGHSMGGYVSLSLAKMQPQWLIGLGLFHSHPYADTDEQRQSRLKSIAFIKRNGHVHYIKQLIPRLFARNAGTSASFRRDLLILRASRSTPNRLINALRAMANREDYGGWLEQYPNPVLFINGAKDPIYTEDQRQKQLALPAVAEVCLLPNSGHMGMIEAVRETQRAVRKFVGFCEEWALSNNQ
ncbi:MAG: alpha/beta hydrolase [Bacteroidota bacterium]